MSKKDKTAVSIGTRPLNLNARASQMGQGHRFATHGLMGFHPLSTATGIRQ